MSIDIYTKDLCGYCDAAKELFDHMGVKYNQYKIGTDITREQLLEIAPNAYAEKDEQGNLPLHMACRGGHVGVVELLMDAGANPNQANNSGVCPLHHVDEPKMVEVLCKAGADPNANAKEGGSPLHFAVADGYTNVIIELIKQGANVEMTD